ncbi:MULTISPECIES: stage V sporulation protein E [Alteribacillus]|uniref:Spore cortex peptidoglycan biosynthesis regulator SpoVE n=1 Tax=Alteribacillus bidgolensis TaxID=930129 RepID=A0A1G8G9C7_9BACI|nr:MULTISPECIES: stage V sporulation protein E [Alteribacillus]SDH90997.1 spore cortex peptidoglycan biosynthesis regulator SpoVE [Alteribacillus bidgolensis]
MEKTVRPLDTVLLAAVIGLLAAGLFMVYSASSVWGEFVQGDSFYFLKRQLIFAGVGVAAMIFISKIDYWFWQRWSVVILVICFFLLIAVLVPGIGMVRGGARSWIGAGAFSIQPSEFMKLGMIIFLAHFLMEHHKKITSFRKGMLPSLLLIFTAFGLIMLQPDLGTGTVMAGTCFVLLFVAGARIRHFVFLGALGIAGFAGLILSAPYRIQRITSFLDPWSDPLGAGFQIIQSLYAVGPGGLFGLGFGDSRQKYYYLPEPQTDFIFAILAEEAGFIGAGFVLILFGILLWRGIATALTAPDMFGAFLATGICGMIFIQVLINIGVVTGLFPVTGITLPFLSYGGSSLTLMLVAVGILLNITRYRTNYHR